MEYLYSLLGSLHDVVELRPNSIVPGHYLHIIASTVQEAREIFDTICEVADDHCIDIDNIDYSY